MDWLIDHAVAFPWFDKEASYHGFMVIEGEIFPWLCQANREDLSQFDSPSCLVFQA